MPVPSLAQGSRFDREALRRELAAALEADLADHAMHMSDCATRAKRSCRWPSAGRS